MYVFEEINRKEVISKAVWECLRYMYKKGFPSFDLDAECQGLKDNPELRKEEKEHPLYQRCYLPAKACREITEAFLHAYRIPPELEDTITILKDYFKEPVVEVWDDKEHTRIYKDKEPMPEDIQKVVAKYLDMAKSFFRWNADESSFVFNVMNIAPCSNRETVERYYRENGQPDFTVPEDSYWDEEDDDYPEDDDSLPVNPVE